MTDDTPDVVGDCEPDDDLWVLPRGDKTRVIHLEAGCHKIPGDAASKTQARFEHVDTPICQFCNDTAGDGGSADTPLAKQIEGAWANE